MSAAGLFDAFFTPPLGGLNLGFTAEERNLAETVHSIAFAEIEKHEKASEIATENETANDSEKIELSKKNLNRILELLEKASGAREEFLENFPDWNVLRRDCIQKLFEIEQSIQRQKFWCNVGKMTGHVIGGAGATAMAWALLFPPAAPVAAIPAILSGIASFAPSFLLSAAPAVVPSLVVNGGIAAGVGGVSSLGSKVVEIGLLRQRMNAAKKVLEGDKRAFAYMANWFKHTKELIQAVEDVIGFDVIKALNEDMDALFADIQDLCDLKNKSPSWLKAAIKLCLRQMLRGKLFSKYLGHGLSAVIVTFIFVVVFLSKKNRFIFKCMVKTKQLMSQFYIDIDAVRELGRQFAAVAVGASGAIEYLPVEMASEFSIGLFAGLGLAISAACIVLTSVDIKRGSPCKQGEEIKKVAGKLQEELDLLEEVYSAVNTSEIQDNIPINELQDLDGACEKLQELDLLEERFDGKARNAGFFAETEDSVEVSHKNGVNLHEDLELLEENHETDDTTESRSVSLAVEGQDSEEILQNSIENSLKELDLLDKLYTSIDSSYR